MLHLRDVYVLVFPRIPSFGQHLSFHTQAIGVHFSYPQIRVQGYDGPDLDDQLQPVLQALLNHILIFVPPGVDLHRMNAAI